MARKKEPTQPALEDVEFGEKTQVEIWADRFIVIGDTHIPHSIRGMKDRFSDLMNNTDKRFVALTNVTVYSTPEKILWQGDFLLVNKGSVVLAKVLKE
jgi:hypothetical protein